MATSLNNLASLYEAQGEYDEAEPLYQRSLAIFERSQRGDVSCAVKGCEQKTAAGLGKTAAWACATGLRRRDFSVGRDGVT